MLGMVGGPQVQPWQGPQNKRSSKRVAENEWTQEERVIEFVKESLFRKACGALVKEPPVEVTPDIVDIMKSKHPVARDVEGFRVAGLRPVDARAAPCINPEDVRKAIRSFPKGSAAGLSALRPQHLKDAMMPGMADECLQQMAGVIQLFARGEAASSVQEW